MILKIDTSDREKFVLGLDAEIKEFKSIKHSEDLLVEIDELLKVNHRKLQDIKQINVKMGAGSYTGLRIGATVANILGWILNIPVIGYENEPIKSRVGKSFSGPVFPKY